MKSIKMYIAAVLLSFCFKMAEGQSSKIVFMPQWTVQSQFAGYYAALEKGFYRDCGLDVEIIHPSASNNALNNLEEGECDIITMQLMQALMSIDRGYDLVNIMQTSQRNSLLVIPYRKDITEISDLKGCKVGIWKAGFGELGHILDNEKDLDIEWIPFVNNVNLFISGAIDATLAMSYNEYQQILACGIRPAAVFRFSDLGYDIPEEGLYVTREYYRTHEKECRAFAEASGRGWKWVREHKDEAIDIVMEYAHREHIKASRILQKKMLDEILSLQHDRQGNIPFRLSKEDLDKASSLLYENGFTGSRTEYMEITGNSEKD